jgi:hypothetical protein
LEGLLLESIVCESFSGVLLNKIYVLRAKFYHISIHLFSGMDKKKKEAILKENLFLKIFKDSTT